LASLPEDAVTPMRDVADVTGPLVAFLAVLALAIGYGGALTDAMTPEPVAADTTPPPCGDRWHVTPGDTLWQIAARCYPGAHTGRAVDAIQRANPGLDAGRLQVGQRLVLPERGR